MRYRSKVEWHYYPLMAVQFLGGASCLWLVFVRGDVLAAFLTVWFWIPLAEIQIPRCFFTYYEFGESILFMRSGIFKDLAIPYKDIIEVTDGMPCITQDCTLSMAMSREKIFLRYAEHAGCVWAEISPAQKEAFLEELKKHGIGR